MVIFKNNKNLFWNEEYYENLLWFFIKLLKTLLTKEDETLDLKQRNYEMLRLIETLNMFLLEN